MTMEYPKNKYIRNKSKSIMAKVMISVEGFKCERCGHEWVPRSKEAPVVCPKCHSPYWDKPKNVKK